MSKPTYVKLSEVIQSPISGSRPSGGVNTETDGVPSLGGENIVLEGGVNFEKLKKIPYSFYSQMPKGKLKDFDVLLNKDGAQTGKLGLYRKMFDEAAVNEHLFILRPKDENILNPVYLYYSLLLGETRRKVESRITGSAQPGLNSQFVDWVTIPFCNPKRQNEISSILETVDFTIEKTEELIEKYQQIKTGLMQDLFTRGIDSDGKLRPSRLQAPELYRETNIGWLPKEWRVISLGNISNITSGVTLNSNLSPAQTVSVPYLRVANVQEGYLDLAEIKEVQVTQAELSRLRLLPGDVLMNEGGDFDKLGRGTVWQGEIECCIHQNHVFRVRVDKNVLRPFFLAYWSESNFGKKYFILSSKQSTNLASINSTQLKAYPIAIPPTDEQFEIEGRVNATSDRINTLREESKKLKMQKQGLLNDLLKGTKSVIVDKLEIINV